MWLHVSPVFTHQRKIRQPKLLWRHHLVLLVLQCSTCLSVMSSPTCFVHPNLQHLLYKLFLPTQPYLNSPQLSTGSRHATMPLSNFWAQFGLDNSILEKLTNNGLNHTHSLCFIQSQTTKVHNFDNSQTRAFCNKLTLDSNSAPSKAPRDGAFWNLSWHFGAHQNFEQNVGYYKFCAPVNLVPRQLPYPLTFPPELSWLSLTQIYDLLNL